MPRDLADQLTDWAARRELPDPTTRPDCYAWTMSYGFPLGYQVFYLRNQLPVPIALPFDGSSQPDRLLGFWHGAGVELLDGSFASLGEARAFSEPIIAVFDPTTRLYWQGQFSDRLSAPLTLILYSLGYPAIAQAGTL